METWSIHNSRNSEIIVVCSQKVVFWRIISFNFQGQKFPGVPAQLAQTQDGTWHVLAQSKLCRKKQSQIRYWQYLLAMVSRQGYNDK